MECERWEREGIWAGLVRRDEVEGKTRRGCRVDDAGEDGEGDGRAGRVGRAAGCGGCC